MGRGREKRKLAGGLSEETIKEQVVWGRQTMGGLDMGEKDGGCGWKGKVENRTSCISTARMDGPDAHAQLEVRVPTTWAGLDRTGIR